MEILQQIMPQIGDQIGGRYRIESKLGEGGFGIVYRGRQENLDREVAIKMLLPIALADKQAVQRFQREVDLVRRLEHPNTVRIFDRGQTDKGLQFYVMEFVKGPTLAEVLTKAGRLPPGRVLHIAEQVLMSLGEAHEKGIVHRDLKPGNIILADVFGRSDFVKVLDFGIGKLVAGRGDGMQITTQSLIGTPYYMSPEQAKSVDSLDGRSDLYALGLIMHEMLTARRAIDGPSPLQVVMAHVTPEPVRLDPEVTDGPLGDVVLHATQKDRDIRYPDATTMLVALQSVQLGEEAGYMTPANFSRPAWSPPPTPLHMPPPVTPSPSTMGRTLNRAETLPEDGAPATGGGGPSGALIGLLILALVGAGVAAAVLIFSGGGGEQRAQPEPDGGSQETVDAAIASGDDVGDEPDLAALIAEQDVSVPLYPETDVTPTLAGDDIGSEDDPAAETVVANADTGGVQNPAGTGLTSELRQSLRLAVETGGEALDDGLDAATLAQRAAAEPAAEADEPEAERITATIRGTPRDANVRVGGETVCRSLPCEVTLPPGDGSVRARVYAPNHLSESISLRRSPGRSYTVDLWEEIR